MTYLLSVTRAGTGSGLLTSSPAGINCGGDCDEAYSFNTSVTLTATPNAVSVFSGWRGDADCTDGTVTMTATRACTAIFNIAPVAGAVQFEAASIEVGEDVGSALLTVTRTGGSDAAISVDYTTTSNGSATAGSDYMGTSGTLYWADGETSSKTFTVTVIDDTEPEGDETVDLVLSNPTGGVTLGIQASSVLSISDNDLVTTPIAIPSMTKWGVMVLLWLMGVILFSSGRLRPGADS